MKVISHVDNSLKICKGEPKQYFWDSYFPESYYCEKTKCLALVDDLLAYGDAVIFSMKIGDWFYKLKKIILSPNLLANTATPNIISQMKKLDYLVCCTDFHTIALCGVAYQWLKTRDSRNIRK